VLMLCNPLVKVERCQSAHDRSLVWVNATVCPARLSEQSGMAKSAIMVCDSRADLSFHHSEP